MKELMISLSLVLLSSSFAAAKSVKVIYGDDNRVDVYASLNSMHVELARSTAAMVSKYNLSKDGRGNVKLEGVSLSSRGICKSERFSHQPTSASCSGFLVGPDLLVTAGHCVRNQSDCYRYKWVFDYAVSDSAQSSISVPETSIYGCKELVSQVLDNVAMNDFALIKLDKEVKDRRFLDYRKSGKIKEGEQMVVVGHPSGLPTKIADQAIVRSLSKNYFSTDLDTYGGNSGSAVFNAATGVVEGILVRGATDYNYDRSKGCRVSNVVGQRAGRGEDVTYITNIPELL